MSVVFVLGTVSLILGFLWSVLAGFPALGGEPSTQTPPSTNGVSKEDAEAVGEQFNWAYTNVIDDLISYIKSPDLQRAQERQESMVEYADSLLPKFKDFADEMEARLNELTSLDGEEEEPATQ